MSPQSGPRPEFKAGQVAILTINNCADAYMAFASAPEEDEFEFLVKHSQESPKGPATLFGQHTDNQVVLKNIVGHGFPVENYEGHDLVFVAMGTGLAPLRSTLRHLDSTAQARCRPPGTSASKTDNGGSHVPRAE